MRTHGDELLEGRKRRRKKPTNEQIRVEAAAAAAERERGRQWRVVEVGSIPLH
jgi:hypothetical protein